LVASICMWCTSNLKILSTFCGKKVELHPLVCGANQTWKLYQQPMVTRKLGCIYLYVVQIKPKNYIRVQGMSKL
jgi:hypothetical protein